MRRIATAAVLTGVGVEEIRANTARTVELLEGGGRKPAGGAEPSPAAVSSTEAVGHPEELAAIGASIDSKELGNELHNRSLGR